MAEHDRLTGLPNRRYLLDKFAEIKDSEDSLAICYMDNFENLLKERISRKCHTNSESMPHLDDNLNVDFFI